MDILGSLGTLATNVKNVTLPGILAAVAFALLLWPPQPYDRIPTVVDNHLDIPNLQLRAKEFANDSTASLGLYRNQSPEACRVKEGSESYTFLAISSNFTSRAAVAVKNQLILDDTDRTLLKCVEEEQALQGVEDQVMANINLLIATRTGERDGLNGLYQKYVQSLSPMKAEFGQKVREKECEIAALQTHLLNFQRLQKDRARRVLELQRLEKEMTLRLGEAGRLRPIQKFDDILSGLSTHIVGFLTLVFAWGLVIDPINRALFSFIYLNGFDDEWDLIRPERGTPGDHAQDKWKGKRPKTWFFAALDSIRSSRPLSVFVVVVCIVGAGLTVVVYPSAVVNDTTTIVSADDLSFSGGSATFDARVVSAGSLDDPAGGIIFQLDDKDSSRIPLVGGRAQYPVKIADLAPNNPSHEIIAKYTFAAVIPHCEGCSVFQSSDSPPFKFVVPEPPSSDSTGKQNAESKGPSTKANPDKAKTKSEGCPDSPAENPTAYQPQTSRQNSVPDLSKPRLLPYWRYFVKCVIVALLALIAGTFLPGVVRPAKPTPPDESEQKTRRLVSAFKRSMEGDPTAKLTCEQKLAKEWPKISQPQYAIGQGLMTRSDFETLQNSYYSQSLVSTGIIVPLLLFIFALLVTPQLGLGSTALYVLLGGGEVLLLVIGVDSRHKYTTELDSLISSAFRKMCANNDKAAAGSSDKSVASQISDALKAAKIVETTDYAIEPDDNPPKSDQEVLAADTAALIEARLRERRSKTNPTYYKLDPGSSPAPAPPQSPAPGKPEDPSGKPGPK
jgi:hypothetical protein